MTDRIKECIADIEKSRNIQVLWACETGSRAWGFASTDSDYDIRIIYVHKKDWYLSLSEKRDSIELMLDNNDIDITGWDLKKSLNLLRKSNASILERIQSPIIYKADPDFISELRGLAPTWYSKIACMHHYLSMSKKFISELEADREFKLKKFFYALRSASVCKWITDKETMPPIEFEKIYTNLNLDPKAVSRIEELIVLKSKIGESYMHAGEEMLLKLIKNFVEEAEKVKNHLPTSRGESEELSSLLRKYITKYDN